MRVMMKMAAVSAVTALLLCCSAFVATDAKDGCAIHVATGESAVVPLKYTLKNTQRLQWKHGDNKIFDRITHENIVTGKKDDIDDKGSLKLTKVDKTKEGKYTAEVFEDGKSKHKESTILCTMDAVLQPKVKIVCSSPSPPSSVTFTCGVTQPNGVEFKWFHNNVLMEKEKGATLVFKDEDKRWKQLETDTFSCNASNRVSVKTSAPVTQTCIKTKSILPEKILGINTWIVIGSGGGVVVVLMIIVIICCCRNRRKRRMRLKDEEELRLGWSNPNQQQQQQQQQHHHHQHGHPADQHHHHHHHHQQQPAGHTGPRQHRSKQQRNQQQQQQQRPRAPDVPNGHPQPSPRRPAQAPKPVDNGDDEQPPPLPQPRKKTPRTPRE